VNRLGAHSGPAAEALGSENVVCVLLPSEFTSSESSLAASDIAGNLGLELLTIPIGDILDTYRSSLSDELAASERSGV